MIDETMRALLAVHRDEINDRDQQIENLTYQAESAKGKAERLTRNLETETISRKLMVERHSEAEAKIAKLEGVIESLKIELADAREAATTARDAAES
ncbi:hypothetical protein WKY82_09170 [Gordonia malaquae]|uniref:hypothetical protein n=1 Tax=Gordonia malaquae TaxID=410332 RepID=UPI0030C794F4